MAEVIAHPRCRVLVDMLLQHHIIDRLHTQVGLGRHCLPRAIHPRMGIEVVARPESPTPQGQPMHDLHLPLSQYSSFTSSTTHTPTSSLEAEHLLANS